MPRANFFFSHSSKESFTESLLQAVHSGGPQYNSGPEKQKPGQIFSLRHTVNKKKRWALNPSSLGSQDGFCRDEAARSVLRAGPELGSPKTGATLSMQFPSVHSGE